MFFKRRLPVLRPSKAHQHLQGDQLPFLTRSRFSALPQFRTVGHDNENLTLFMAIFYVIDLFGVFPLITLPNLLVELGVYGIPLVVSVIVLQIYTSYLLSRCWSLAESLDPSIVEKKRYPYAAIADLAYGPSVSLLVSILLDLSIFATAIPNIVIASQNLELVGKRLTDGNITISYCYWVIIVGIFICPMMWMGSPKHMRGLLILSVCVVVTIIVLLWYCLFAATPIGRPYEGISLNAPPVLVLLNGYSLLAFQFDIHSVLLTLQIDMRQKSHVWWASLSGISTTCTVAILTSVVAAYKFGSMIAENLLETIPKSIPLIILLILVAIQLCFSATVGSTAMFLQIENYLKIPERFSVRRVLLRTSLVAVEVLIAEFVPSFDALMDIVGGTITGPLVFILPPLIYRRINHMERLHQRVATEVAYGSIPIDLNYEPTETEPLIWKMPRSARGKCVWLTRFLRRTCCNPSLSMAVLVFGVSATFLATYLNLFELNELFRNGSPCFGNFTKRP